MTWRAVEFLIVKRYQQITLTLGEEDKT